MKARVPTVARVLAGAVASVAVAACASHATAITGSSRAETPPVHIAHPVSTATLDDDPPSVASHLVAQIAGQKSLGPFLAKRAGGAILVYMDGDRTARQLTTVALHADGSPAAEPRIIFKVPAEPTMLVARPGGDGTGYYAAWAALLDRGEAVTIAALDANGGAQGGTNEVARTNDHVRWLEVFPVPQGALCVWAEQTTDRDVSIFAAGLDETGKPRGLPTRVAKDVRGWQVVSLADGVGVATAMRDDEAARSTLSWQRVDVEGRALGSAVTVASGRASMADVDAVSSGNGVVLAWTDRTADDPDVTLASVDATGRTQLAPHAMQAFGGAELVRLAGGPAGAVLAWKEPTPRPSGARRVHLASIKTSPALVAEDATVAEYWPYPEGQGPAVPEIASFDGGYAALMNAQACTAAAPVSPRDPPCSTSTTVIPTFVRFDASLAPLDAEPFRLGDNHDAATLGWSLDCAGGPCLALAAATATPVPISVVDLAAHTSQFLAPVVPPLPANAPRVVALKTLATGEPYADVDAERVGAGTLVTTLTDAVDIDAEGHETTAGATLAVRPYDANGEQSGPPVVLTRRAISAGGVAIAAGGKPEDGAAIAWTARERGVAQVHVARVDRTGRKTNDVQLTGARGGTSDVAIAWAGGGWTVAWVDARDGNGEVYAARVDLGLNRTSHEERLTDAAGDAVDVTMLADGDRVWIAWGDPRESVKDGFSDIYVRAVSAKDAKPLTDEVRVLGTAAHSRSPALARSSDGLWIGWVEDAPAGLDAPNGSAYGAIVAKLDPNGRPLHDPAHAPMGGEGRATAIALEPDPAGGTVRGYIARSMRGALVIDGFDVTAPDAQAYPIVELPGVAMDASVAVLGDALIYDDHGTRAGERRLRRATVAWKR